MEIARALLVATAPAALWMWLYYRRDRWEPEPLRFVVLLAVLGAVMAGATWLLQALLPGAQDGGVYDLFVRVAFLEELAKLLPVVWFAGRTRRIDEPMDGIVYAVAAALGFATVENALYAWLYGPLVVVLRAFTATLAHVAFSGLVGYHFGRALARGGSGHSRAHRRVVIAFLAAVVLHGSYDALLRIGADPRNPVWIGRAAVMFVIPAALLLLGWAVRLADRASPFRPRGQA